MSLSAVVPYRIVLRIFISLGCGGVYLGSHLRVPFALVVRETSIDPRTSEMKSTYRDMVFRRGSKSGCLSCYGKYLRQALTLPLRGRMTSAFVLGT